MKSAIGILGGVGPYAGLDLVRKLFDATVAATDQEHLPVLLFSFPDRIVDRTRFLLGETQENPGEAMGNILCALADAGASVIGIPCNTAHSPRILQPALSTLAKHDRSVRFVHMIEAVVTFIRERYPQAKRIGILSTRGTYQAAVYQHALAQFGLTALFPDAPGRDRVHEAIIHPDYGVKACSNPVSAKARALVEQEAAVLTEQGAEVIILGCTELPLIGMASMVPLIDTTQVLAHALIRSFAPERLKESI